MESLVCLKGGAHEAKGKERGNHMDADEGLVLAGASLGMSMLAVWIVFIIALLWIRGPG